MFIANANVATNPDGTIESDDIGEEMKRFYETRVYGKKDGIPRVFAYNGLTYEAAAYLHLMFNNVANFRVVDNSKESFKSAVLSLLMFLRESLKKPTNYFDDTIIHLYEEESLPPERRPKINKDKLQEIKNPVRQALEYSAHEFFHKHAFARLDTAAELIWNDIEEFSRIFKDITQIESRENKQRKNITNIGECIYNVINECLKQNTSEKLILKIKSPLGSYKNRLLQYIYLYISKTLDGVLPFFLDVAMCEKTDTNRLPDDSIENRVIRNLDYIKRMVNAHPDLTPFVIVDGIRDFACGKIEIYDKIKKCLDKLDCYWVVGVDTDFTNNGIHIFNYNSIATDNFKYFIRISSMKLDRKQESKDFIKVCIEIFKKESRDIDNYSTTDVDKLYDKFINKFELISMDAYWLIAILGNMSRYSPENIVE